MNKHKGFTLVELLISIVVIGILASIGIISYDGMTKNATNSAILTNVGDWDKTIKAYESKSGALANITSDTPGQTGISRLAFCLGGADDFPASADFAKDVCATGDFFGGDVKYSEPMLQKFKSEGVDIPEKPSRTINDAPVKMRGAIYISAQPQDGSGPVASADKVSKIIYQNYKKCASGDNESDIEGSNVKMCERILTIYE